MGIKAQNKTEKYKKIFEKKIYSTISQLCDKLPTEFIDFMRYIKDLAFEDKPNYQYLKTLLGKMYDKNNFSYEMVFDFTDILTKKENSEKDKKNQDEILSTSFLEKKEKNEKNVQKDKKDDKKEDEKENNKEKKSEGKKSESGKKISEEKK